MAISRRSFIKICGGTLGVGAVGSGLVTDLWGLSPDVVHDPLSDGDRVVPTYCDICFWKCGVLAHVRDGKVTKLVGNPAHPLARGRLCPRGTGGHGLTYDPDRLKWPLLRRDKGGSQVYERVSWDAALDVVAERLAKVKAEHGPEALALFSHGMGGSWFKQLLEGYGSSNKAGPSYAQCRGSREVAFELTYGQPVGSPEATDIENARVMTLIGSHLGENMHNTQVQWLARMIDKGGELVVVDPRFSVAAGKARHWLPIRPGTDIALLLAWMHVIVGEGLYDASYLDANAIGFPELKKHLQDKTPQWAFVHTGIAPEKIVETARFVAGARPASLIHPGRRAAWYGDDTQRGRAIAILNALLGSWGRRGGFYLPSKLALPGYPMPEPSHAAVPREPPDMVDMPKGVVYPFANSGLAHGLRDASIPGTAAYDIKAWMVYGTNLVQSLPEPKKTIEALQAQDFVVVVDVLPTEITGYADVVLPESTYLERHDDLHVCAFKEPFIALRQPVIEPLYESKPGWWIAKQLGERLGLGEYFPWQDIDAYLQRRLAAGGYDMAALRRDGVIVGEETPLYYEDGVAPSFATPSGKIELYSKAMADAGLDPMPSFTAHPQPGPGEFRLLFGRAPTHTFGRTTNNRFLSEVFSDNPVWVNAAIAAEAGLKAGDLVTLINQDGVRSQPVTVKPTQRIRPDAVYMVHGFGHTSDGLTFAKGRGADDSRLVTRVDVDPAMGGTGMNSNFVRLERYTGEAPEREKQAQVVSA